MCVMYLNSYVSNRKLNLQRKKKEFGRIENTVQTILLSVFRTNKIVLVAIFTPEVFPIQSGHI